MDEQATQEQPSIEERLGALLNPEPPKEEETAEVSADAPADASPEEEPVEAESVAAESAEADATEGDSEGETVTVSSLAELMESVGAEVDSMYDLTFPVTIDGQRQDVSLSEIKDSYRASKEAQRFQEEAKASREEAKQFAEQTQEQIKQQLAQAHKLAEGLDAMYLAPFNNVDWQALRQDDPAEYAAKRQEYIDTKNAVDAQKQSVMQEIDQFQSQAQAEQARVQGEVLAREREALYEKWPEMADETKADAERSALVSFLKTDGFTDDEIGSVADHRLLLLLRDAMRYRTQAKQADAAKKKVIKIGKKVLTPSAAKSKAEKAVDRVQPLRNQLRKSGKVEDAAALLSQSFQGRK